MFKKEMTAQKDGAPHYEDGDSLPATAEDGGPEPLQPPADRLPGIRSPLLLMVQTLGLMLSILPAILYSVLRKIVPPAGKSLKDKVVLVTGAGRGLGEGLAMRFAKEGAKVAVVDVFPQSAQETARDIQENGGIAKAYVANVAKVEDIQRLRREVTEDLGPVDILVNNAGLMYGNTVTDMPDTDLRAVVEVNLLSHFWMAKEFLPSMKDRNSGHIVAICSLSALSAPANAAAYSCCKSGVKGFMESLRAELNSQSNNDIKVTTVLPYFINTSASYVEFFDLRIPPVSIEEAVEATVEGIKREEVVFTIPRDMYFSVHLFQLFPQYIIDKFKEIFYFRVALPSEERRKKEPTQHIISQLSSK
ncbi:17-beta-hydroxysteroid dehydrogenase 13-like [Macrosteles quadrilineatus]|uniref:17-beta-hydroxysteroid dehydrogenase 13-like n=1 Tax=Macrosteles quadrilineatus TaxID=74068 RepID=UPI0023E205DA|nr:17-beta-hydroxysteroid dehydrogenase 13-like [Macrosteles quadrilineatus]